MKISSINQAIQHGKDSANTELESVVLEKTKEITILLLGETGVGKSTFINAYYNYLNFESFEHAREHGELKSLINSTFSFTNSDLEVEKIRVGGKEDPNEVSKEGQSSTQHANAYEFHKVISREGDEQACRVLIRIIDTPGFGDSRGIAQDQENFKRTIEYISRFETLNAICLLLKPNDKRFLLGFRYCFKELFSHLNKEAINNIIFCFTNCRSTSYKPGETYPNLKRFLTEEIEQVSNVKVPLGEQNIACFDSEAFRYLVLLDTIKRKRSTDNQRDLDSQFMELNEPSQFCRSWMASSKASEKIVQYSMSLTPLSLKRLIFLTKSFAAHGDLNSNVVDLMIKISDKELTIQSMDQIKKLDSSSTITLLNVLLHKLLAHCARLSNFYRGNSSTIYNDQLDALFEEKIEEYQSRFDSRPQDIARMLADLRVHYKRCIKFEPVDKTFSFEREMGFINKLLQINLKVPREQLENAISLLLSEDNTKQETRQKPKRPVPFPEIPVVPHLSEDQEKLLSIQGTPAPYPIPAQKPRTTKAASRTNIIYIVAILTALFISFSLLFFIHMLLN